MRIAFFGTPAFALATLERLHASRHRVVVVVTQPDRPRGRGHKLMPGPVKAFATRHGLPVLQPERLADEDFYARFESFDADLGVVAAYGKILPSRLLALPRRGLINVHASLLPRWRGAAPVHRAILAGDRQTGVSIMRVVAALDAGPVLARDTVHIDENETSAELESRLAELGASLLVETVDGLADGDLTEVPQDERAVTYAPRLERRDSQIDWARPATAVHDQVRGLHPWPLAAAMLGGRRVLLLRSQVAHTRGIDVPPGVVSTLEPDGIVVAALPGAVRITEIQPEGRAPMRVRQFLNGYRLAVGSRFEPLPVAP